MKLKIISSVFLFYKGKAPHKAGLITPVKEFMGDKMKWKTFYHFKSTSVVFETTRDHAEVQDSLRLSAWVDFAYYHVP